MTSQFKGETAWDAIVNDNSLDIEEEDEFRDWLRVHGFDIGDEYHINPDISLEQLTNGFAMWQAESKAA